MGNIESNTWLENFMQPNERLDEKAIDFIANKLPKDEYKRVLELDCDMGRYSIKLAEKGYDVTGIDRDERVIENAKNISKDVSFYQHNLHKLDKLEGEFDAIISIGARFGYFDSKTNKEVLKQIYNKLNNKGKFILDIYNPKFFENNQGITIIDKYDNLIKERKWIKDGRLFVEIDFGKDIIFNNWELLSIDYISQVADEIGFTISLITTDFTDNQEINDESPRIQFVLEK